MHWDTQCAPTKEVVCKNEKKVCSQNVLFTCLIKLQKYSKLWRNSGTENIDSMFSLWDQYFLTGFIRYLKEYCDGTIAVAACIGCVTLQQSIC